MEISNIVGLLTEKLSLWAETLVSHIPNFVLAVLVIIFFAFLAKYAKKITINIIHKFHVGESLVQLSGKIVSIIVICIGLFFALGILDLQKTVTSLLAGAGIIGLALGFAFQDLTANFLSGIFISVQKPISIGDVVETNGYFGQVKQINLRSTIINNFGGQEIEIPSKDIFQNPIKNYSTTGEWRMQLNCGVAYDTDLQMAEDTAHEAISSLPFLQEGKEVQVLYEEFGSSSINFKIWFWIDREKMGPPGAMSEAVKALKKAFDEKDINIPFPIRTLELKNQREILAPFTNNHN
ncbi:mechanosensitive ion channel family protein [Flexithrix dorotheae]|uniref:mechanosensitive ion channel family protein n=1 Tax=Flexithrix dorotheae TaxID=70993 RepID=UPI00039DA9D1|nr:mechanosensitive ion channel family protein [Flexithrix dorotheae]